MIKSSHYRSVVSAILLGTLLAGCGGGSGDGNESDETQTQQLPKTNIQSTNVDGTILRAAQYDTSSFVAGLVKQTLISECIGMLLPNESQEISIRAQIDFSNNGHFTETVSVYQTSDCSGDMDSSPAHFFGTYEETGFTTSAENIAVVIVSRHYFDGYMSEGYFAKNEDMSQMVEYLEIDSTFHIGYTIE